MILKVRKKGKTRGRPSKQEKEASAVLTRLVNVSTNSEWFKKWQIDTILYGYGYVKVYWKSS